MGKATIKIVNNPMGGTTGISATVASTGAAGKTQQNITSPPGQVMTGTLVDDQSGTSYNFSQPFGAELGLQVGEKVNYETITTSSGVTLANSVKLFFRGVVKTVDTKGDAGGTLTDKISGLEIPFAQTNAVESGIVVGSKVNFVCIVDPVSGNFTAVALVVIK